MKEKYKYIVWTDEVDHYFKSYKQAKKTYNKLTKHNDYVYLKKIDKIVKEINESTRSR